MPEVAGKDRVIKISGTATAMVGEATTSVAGNFVYKITSATKQVLEKTGSISVQKKGTNDITEVATTTTNLRLTAHGLLTGDLIINTTRSSAARIVTLVDANNLTVTSVTGQTNGDTIEVYKTELTTAYSLNRLNGTVTYASAAVRVIKISGNYLPMSTAAFATSMSTNRECAILETPKFGSAYMTRIAGLKNASGTLAQFDVTDETYVTALIAGNPVVIENLSSTGAEPDRFWALLESTELAAAIASVQTETISWISTDEWIRLGV